MAGQDPSKPKDDGKIGMPRIDSAMNKLPSPNIGGGKGSDKDSAMMPKADEAEDEKILARIRKRLERCLTYEAMNRRLAIQDLKFKAGEQWPADVAAQRNLDKRPMLTINKIPTFIHQLTNDQRQNRPSINVNPMGDGADIEVAKFFRGKIRAIERDSTADIAYDTAFESAVSMGWGYWAVETEYESDDSLNQVICIRRRRNPFTIYLDPDHKEPDGADCKYGVETEMIPRDEFLEEYPDADPVSFEQAGVGEPYKNWIGKDEVRVALYYECDYEYRDLVQLENGHTGYWDELDDLVKQRVVNKSLKVLNKREVPCPKWKWYKCTALQILDRGDWVGKWLPIVPVIYNEIDIEGKVTLSGIVRDAIDPQKMYNYWATSETELVALQPKAPFIVEEGQIEGHEQEWKMANIKNLPYLSYKATNVNGTLAPPPQRQPMTAVPASIVNAKQGAAQDMMAVTGIRFDATMNERMIDESGRAIRELRRSGDLGSFHGVDNLARSLRHLGRLLIDLICKTHDTKRMVSIVGEDGSEDSVQVDPHQEVAYKEIQLQNRKLKSFNPNIGKYGVTVTIGPSFATKRIEAAESMMDFAKALPQSAMLIADLIAKNQDWDGAEEMATRLAKALPANLLTPEQKDVPPQMQAFIQSLQQQIQQMGQQMQGLQAALNDKQADRALTQDKINKDFEAKMAAVVEKIEAGGRTQGSQLKDLADGLTSLVNLLSPPTKDSSSTPS